MKKLKTKLQKTLKECCANVYFENAPDTATVPYLVYDLTQGIASGVQTIYLMDVDVWDKNESSERVDNICKKLRELNGRTYIDAQIQFSMYFDRVVNAKSENKNWKRKRVVLQVRTIERS